MNHIISIKICSSDANLIEQASKKIYRTIKPTGAVIKGPIPMPTKRKLFTLLRSPHVSKESREQFEQRVHKRLIVIIPTNSKVLEALMKLELPAGIEVAIKV